MELAKTGRFADAMDSADAGVARSSADVRTLVATAHRATYLRRLWARLGLQPTLFECPWPQADAALAAEESMTIVVQVNGKVRDSLEVPVGTEMDRVVELARAREKVIRYLAGQEMAKTITVPGKLVNFVVK